MNDFLHLILELWLVLASAVPLVIKIVNCVAATVCAIKIFHFKAERQKRRFLGFIAWMLFISFASIPIFTLFGEYENHSFYEMNINVFIAILLWFSDGSISPKKLFNKAA